MNPKDEDYCINLLISLKHLKSLYNTFSQESSSDSIYKIVNSNYTIISKLQRELYNLMCECNFYTLTYEQSKKIKQVTDKYSPKIK
ncbi:MAG: spore coat protein [Erysipelotrichaceae bacterium]